MTWLFALALLLADVFRGGVDHPAIGYTTKPERNAVADLRGKTAGFLYGAQSGYLRAVLEALDVPVESRLVVFSKTSAMARIISPQNPRSIYFNDTTVVAWVAGEPFVEVAVQDAELGVLFYTMDQKRSVRPSFDRTNACLTCHESLATEGVPGMLLRSVFPDANGQPQRQLGDFVTDHRSPFAERWGGYFVSGRQLPPKHMGTVAQNSASDVVALLVFDHQMRAMNLLTRAGWDARLALHEGKPELLPDLAKELADYLLFVDEAPLPRKIEGSSGFAEKFAARGPLRQFDLTRRLFRTPCSYMIYSPAFDALPATFRDAVYRRMWEVLSRFPKADRTAVITTLRETKKGLPSYFEVR